MADELVGPAKALGVHDLVAVDDHRIVHGAAPGQAHGAQGLDLVEEAEGAAVGELAPEGGGIHLQVHGLPADGAGGEGDLEGDLESVGGPQGGALVALDHLDHVGDLDDLAKGALTAHAGAVEAADEVDGRAVHDRHLGPVDLDDRIVDAGHDQGGHQVLDGRDGHARRIGDHRPELGLADGLAADRHAVVEVLHIGADEDDARTGRGREHGDTGLHAGVDPDAGKPDGAVDGVLVRKIGHDGSLRRHAGRKDTPSRRR